MRLRPRVLVIDDDPLYRSLLAALLRRDFAVCVACEGSEAFEKALEHPPEVVILDIHMPGWDGLKTLRAFRSHPALARVHIMIFTADASKETVLAAIRGGANDYIIKSSFSRDEFLRKLSRFAATGHPASPVAAQAIRAVQPVETAVPANACVKEDIDLSRLQELIDEWD